MKDEKSCTNIMDDLWCSYGLLGAAIVLGAAMVLGMALGAWMTFRYMGLLRDLTVLLPPLPIPVAVHATVLPVAVPVPVHTIYIAPSGARFHLDSSCAGLRIAGSMSTKTRCLLCA